MRKLLTHPRRLITSAEAAEAIQLRRERPGSFEQEPFGFWKDAIFQVTLPRDTIAPPPAEGLESMVLSEPHRPARKSVSYGRHAEGSP